MRSPTHTRRDCIPRARYSKARTMTYDPPLTSISTLISLRAPEPSHSASLRAQANTTATPAPNHPPALASAPHDRLGAARHASASASKRTSAIEAHQRSQCDGSAISSWSALVLGLFRTGAPQVLDSSAVAMQSAITRGRSGAWFGPAPSFGMDSRSARRRLTHPSTTEVEHVTVTP